MPGSNYYQTYNSAQNIRSINFQTKEGDSPHKNEPLNKNIRKPDFLKNLSKGVPPQPGDERKSYK